MDDVVKFPRIKSNGKHSYGGPDHKKNKLTKWRFTVIDVNFDVKYEGQQNC